ncbi:hypothetical protein O3M35_012650 [Rhynocoris fuscipes]|uniref:Uncharacterized protein n=1 Tax=Rhynocoris fuscipes TaxID=488301 RepID=A0AAW1CW93_9HEMI
MISFIYWLIISVLTVLEARPRLPPCRLGTDLLNGLVNSKNQDHDEYGIENTFGLVGDHPGNVTDKEDLSSKEFQDCIQHYLHSGSANNSAINVAPLNLHYEKLPNIGNSIAMPVPIPDDEDYLPGKEGYTTYVNPYKFKEKGYFNKVNNKNKNIINNKDSDDKFIDELLDLFEDWL